MLEVGNRQRLAKNRNSHGQILLAVRREAEPRGHESLALTLRRVLILPADLGDAHRASGEICDTARGLVDHGHMNVLTLESVVVVEPPCINQRDVTLAVSGDDFFLALAATRSRVGLAGSGMCPPAD
jgi:hypothetical protein